MTDKQENIFENGNGGTVAPAIVSGLPTQGPTNAAELESMVERAELSVDLMNRVKRAAIKLTNESDWCFQGNTLFPEVSAATKIAQQFGVSVIPAGPTKREPIEDEEGTYIIVSVPLTARWMNAEITEIGTCSTRDKLLGRANGKYKPLSEVDLTNVERKAQASGIRRAIIRVMGLKFTEQELRDAELNVDKIREERGVSYGSGSRGGNTDSKEITERKNAVQTKMVQMWGDNWKDQLEQFTAFKAGDGKQIKGKTEMRYVTEKQLPFLEEKVEKAWNAYCDQFPETRENGEGPGNDS